MEPFVELDFTEPALDPAPTTEPGALLSAATFADVKGPEPTFFAYSSFAF